MKKHYLATIVLALIATWAFSKNLTQTVRGTILDIDSKSPLIGATISIVGSNPIIGTVTNLDGNFRLENIPTGRISLQLSYIGYENKIIPNIEVSSGKEVVLNLGLQESAVKLDEVIVRRNKNKGEAINDMALISSRSISVEESKRYAGGFDDPSRVVTNFAGVANSPNGGSDIIVRGNAPKYLRWRIEGMEISSPYHFDDQNASFGGLSALNNKLLSASDFHTGAFSPEYGDVLAGVYDINIRTGNNEKHEGMVGAGLVGTDVTLEGPFKKGYGGSYLVNYRYSTATLITDLGLVDIGGSTNFQDATYKLFFPTRKAGTFSFFGVTGVSSMSVADITPDFIPTSSNTTKKYDLQDDYDKKNHLVNVGINHILPINSNSFIKSSFMYSSSRISDEVFQSQKGIDSSGEFIEDSVNWKRCIYDNLLVKSAYRGAILYSNKINAKHKIQLGTKYTLYDYDYSQSKYFNEKQQMVSLTNFKEQASAINNFISWKYRPSENITLVTGLHNMNVLLNNKSTLEPRIALKWKLNKSNSLSAGYGAHSTMESIHHYFALIEQEDGSITQANKDLDLLKAHHFVLGYEKRFTENLIVKAELYYQHLYNLPVENNDTSFFATINEGLDYRYVDLVNEGTGKNYGIELTLERFFANNYFFLLNGSLFNSSYKSREGIERNTVYNNNYLVNVLAGKEFQNLGKKKNQTLALNVKLFFEGGQKHIPLLRDEQGELAVDPENNLFWDYEKAYESSIDKVFQLNLSASYKFDRRRTTHEIFLDLQNLTNNTARMSEYYDENEPGSVGYIKQFGFFPNLMYRVYF